MKTKLVLLYLLCALLTACHGHYDDWADPQIHWPKDLIDVDMDAEPLSLELDPTLQDSILLATVAAEHLAEHGQYKFEIHLGWDSLFNTDVVLPHVFSHNEIRVATLDLEDAVWQLFGRTGQLNTACIRVDGVLLAHSGEAFVLQGKNQLIHITTRRLPVESQYYIQGDINGWQERTETLVPMTQTSYGVFELVAHMEMGWSLKVVPASAIINKYQLNQNALLGAVLEVDDSSMGLLQMKRRDHLPGRLLAASEGDYKLRINLNDYTYTFSPMAYSVWVPGEWQGWVPALATQLFYKNGAYTGYTYANGRFQITSRPNWDIAYGYFYFEDNHSDNITRLQGDMVLPADIYYLTVDLENRSIDATPVTWGIISTATAGGLSTETPMTYDVDTHTWSLTTHLDAGTFRFRRNGSSEVNLGGSPNKLEQDGADLSVSTAGTYTIVLTIHNDGVAFCTLTTTS